jgi:nitrogen fixation NifU-like protein
MASASSASEWTDGRQIEGAKSIQHCDIARHLHLPPAKLRCSMPVEDTIQAALKDTLISEQ